MYTGEWFMEDDGTLHTWIVKSGRRIALRVTHQPLTETDYDKAINIALIRAQTEYATVEKVCDWLEKQGCKRKLVKKLRQGGHR